MEIILAKSAGFCFGVQRAVDTAYKEAGKQHVYTYGPIIHNEEVIEDLRKKGVLVIEDLAELDQQEDETVIIRSHGVSKDVMEQLETRHVNVPRIAMIARPVLELIRFRTMTSVIRININPIVNVLSFGVPLIPCGPFRRIFPSGSMFKDTESFIEKWNPLESLPI